ncbi:MAG: 3-hydroxyacyl-CoA dehydrogenase NAD-binding domain-containing protein [Halofilum sp. (in: g-proteobacteria)]|nr:3-hydroxyacyl-CoA dehydrogenase NAD-binding domain-containing protein [Halofilum sp. (in: g-proteobacteria)]
MAQQHLGLCRSTRAGRGACRVTSGARFCGVHFFNPPRYMHLVELIPHAAHGRPGAGRPRGLPHHRARQGRGAGQGHAQLHR